MSFDKLKVKNLLSSVLVTVACGLGGFAALWGFNLNWEASESTEIQSQVTRLTSVILEKLVEVESHAAAESTSALSKPLPLAEFVSAFKQEFPFVQSIELLSKDGQVYIPKGFAGQPLTKSGGPGVVTLLESALMTSRPIYSPISQSDKNLATVTLISPARRNEPFSLCLKISLSDLLSQSIEKLNQDNFANYNNFQIFLNVDKENIPRNNSKFIVTNQTIERLGLSFNVLAQRSRSMPDNLIGIRFTFTVFGALTGLFLALWLRGTFIRHRNKQKLQELQLQIENESKIALLGEMSTAIAHELNQPLGAIENYAFACEKILSQQEGISNQIFEGLTQIRLEASRSSGVIRSIRAFVSKGEQNPISNNLAKLLSELMPLLEIQAKINKSELQIDCNPSATVVCDRSLLQQVILNLAKNGFEAMNGDQIKERVLKISVINDMDLNQIQIIFDDTGSGISSENSAQLFRPFFSTKPDGLGVGLGFCLSIAEHNGGSIKWSNKSTGGAQFVLALPASQ